MTECIFCNIAPASMVVETGHLVAFKDRFPVTNGHILIVPKSHRRDAFDLDGHETAELFPLLNSLRAMIKEQDPTVTGFNIGMNCGESAGQTVFHCHVHLIPRRDGDCENPKGGVRGVIPAKQSY